MDDCLERPALGPHRPSAPSRASGPSQDERAVDRCWLERPSVGSGTLKGSSSGKRPCCDDCSLAVAPVAYCHFVSDAMAACAR